MFHLSIFHLSMLQTASCSTCLCSTCLCYKQLVVPLPASVINHFSPSPEVSEWASEWMSEWMKERSVQCGASKWVSGAGKRTSEWPSTYILYSWLFWTLVLSRAKNRRSAYPWTTPWTRAIVIIIAIFYATNIFGSPFTHNMYMIDLWNDSQYWRAGALQQLYPRKLFLSNF